MTYPTREPVEPVEPVEPAVDPVTNVNAPSGRYGAPVAVSPLAPIRHLIWLVFGVLVALIAIRFVFLALGANEGNVIVDAVYAITEPLVAPFRGIFNFDEVRPIGESVIDVAALVAIVGWALVAAVIGAILRIPDRTAA
jgi:YggT family protein